MGKLSKGHCTAAQQSCFVVVPDLSIQPIKYSTRYCSVKFVKKQQLPFPAATAPATVRLTARIEVRARRHRRHNGRVGRQPK